MELQYFRYFMAVAEQRSFSMAAKMCAVSQPALSAQIKKMENILGCELFHRNKRNVQLTKMGANLIPTAQRVLFEIENFKLKAQSENADVFCRHLSAGLSPLISQSKIFETLERLQAKHPNLKLSMTEDSTQGLIESLKSHRFDIVFLPWFKNKASKELDAVIVDEDKMLLCFPKKQKHSKEDLPFIGSHGGCGLRSAMEEASKILGFRTQSPYAAHHVDMIKKWVHLGLGWSLLPSQVFNSKDYQELEIKRPSKNVKIQFAAVMLRGKKSQSFLKEFV